MDHLVHLVEFLIQLMMVVIHKKMMTKMPQNKKKMNQKMIKKMKETKKHQTIGQKDLRKCQHKRPSHLWTQLTAKKSMKMTMI